MTEDDAAGPLAHRNRRRDLVSVAVDNADGVVLLVGNVDRDRLGGGRTGNPVTENSSKDQNASHPRPPDFTDLHARLLPV